MIYTAAVSSLLYITLFRIVGSFKEMGALQVVFEDVVDPETGVITKSEIDQTRMVDVNQEGTAAAFSRENQLDCVVSIGCYKALSSPSPRLYDVAPEEGQAYTPRDCWLLCSSMPGMVVAGVSGSFCSCAASIESQWQKAASEEQCQIECTTEFKTPICGGEDDHWNLFMCYTHIQVGSLAVDPWRNLVFRTASINWYYWLICYCVTDVLECLTGGLWQIQGVSFVRLMGWIVYCGDHRYRARPETPAVNEDGIVNERAYDDAEMPETYFLFVADISTGDAKLEYHMKETQSTETELMIYTGLTFDVDSSRIVCLMMPARTARIQTTTSFNYKLGSRKGGRVTQLGGMRSGFSLKGLIRPKIKTPGSAALADDFGAIGGFIFVLVIKVDTMDPTLPQLTKVFSPMYTDVATKTDIFADGASEATAAEYFQASDNAGIISKNGLDTYIFSVSYGIEGGIANTVKSKVMFVDISTSTSGTATLGHVYHTAALDCVVVQLAVNEYYGDVGAMVNRNGNIEFLSLARVYRQSQTQALIAEPFWTSSGSNVQYMIPVSETANLNLLAGVSASNHMYNRSCHGIMLYDTVGGATYTDDRKVLQNQPTGSEAKLNAIPSVLCFDIRTEALSLWGGAKGTARSTEDGIESKAVTMELYQPDPGFPMTLPRAEMSNCEMSMTGLSAVIQFDSVTLMGGKCKDIDYDGIPDTIDYSYEVTSHVSAKTCFADASFQYLEGATCAFIQKDQIEIILDKSSTLTFGHTLCIRPNFVCRTQNDQWSAYSTGCCKWEVSRPNIYVLVKVQVPSDLVPPKPNLRADPSLVVDVCADVTLDFGDTQFCGRKCTYVWKLESVTALSSVATGGANDGGVGGNSSHADKVELINEVLAEANLNNAFSVTLYADMLAKASYHIFEIEVTSAWALTTTEQFTVQKLADSAPTVTIVGELKIGVYRNKEYFLNAVGKASQCVSAENVLGYKWSFANCSVNLANVDTIQNQNRLRVPAGTHQCPGDIVWFENDFNAAACEVCSVTVEVFLVDSPSKKSHQSMSVYLLKSELVPKCYNPDFSKVQKGKTLYINCGSTEDPDDIHSGVFKGNFKWKCRSGATLLPCFGETPEFSGGIKTCVQDYTVDRFVGDGGVLYPQIAFDDRQMFCRVGRGTVAINTALMDVGNYTFGMEVTHFDNKRSTAKEIDIELTNYELPKINLELVSPYYEKFPIGKALKVQGTHNLNAEKYPDVTYSWSLLERQRNLDYDPDQAEQYKEQGLTYPVPEFTYVKVDLLALCTNDGTARWTSTSPTITVGPDCLKLKTQYTLRLTVMWSAVVEGTQMNLESFSDIRIATASGPPTKGKFIVKVRGEDGGDTTETGCELDRVFTAEEWISEDTPLKFRFGYIVDDSHTLDTVSDDFLVQDAVKYWLTDAPQPVRTQTGLVQCGREEYDYRRIVFVYIENSAGEYVYKFQEIVATPPEDPVKAAAAILEEASGQAASNPENTITLYMAALGILSKASEEEKNAVTDKILDSVSGTKCISPECGERQLVFLNSMAASGVSMNDKMQDVTLSTMEDNIQRIEESSALITDQQTYTLFQAISAILAGPRFMRRGGANSGGRRRLMLTPHDTVALKPVIRAIYPEGSYEQGLPLKHVVDPIGYEHGTVRRLSGAHHEEIEFGQSVVTECPEPFCDKVGVKCMKGFGDWGDRHHALVCCQEYNPTTGCFQPPCWFYGRKCSVATYVVHSAMADEAKTAMKVPGGTRRRISSRRGRWWGDWVERFVRETDDDTIIEDTNLTEFDARQEWQNSDGRQSAFRESQSDREHRRLTDGYGSGEVRRRQLIEIKVSLQQNLSQTYQQGLLSVAEGESAAFEATRALYLEAQRVEQIKRAEDIEWEMYVSTLSPQLQTTMRQKKQEQAEIVEKTAFQERRNTSQVLTRVEVIRDAIVKRLVNQLVANEDPKVYDVASFVIYIGKSTDLSAVHPSFSMPSKYVVPSNSPDNPTPDNPITGFSFEYVEYKMDPRSWSISGPVSSEQAMVTLLVMKANPDLTLTTSVDDEPIRVFADRDLYSNALCMYWDRFAPGTAGGAWTEQGNLNDAQGCLVTRAGDIGLFIDGKIPEFATMAVAADLPFLLRAPPANRFFVLSVLGFTSVLIIVLSFWGYKFDESMRDDQRRGRAALSPYHLDGDGITSPLTIVDPIAYQYISSQKGMREKFLLFTFWNVLRHESVVLAPLYYSESFTRPQRLLCALTMMAGIMGVSALIYGTPNTFASSSQFVATGILSALVVYPAYCVVYLMFSMRPTPYSRRIIKRKAPNDERDRIRDAMRMQEASSSKIPKSVIQGGLPALGSITSPYKPLVGGLPALPPIPSHAPQGLPVAGLAIEDEQRAVPPPRMAEAPKPPPQALLPPIYFGGTGGGGAKAPALPPNISKALPPPAPPPRWTRDAPASDSDSGSARSVPAPPPPMMTPPKRPVSPAVSGVNPVPPPALPGGITSGASTPRAMTPPPPPPPMRPPQQAATPPAAGPSPSTPKSEGAMSFGVPTSGGRTPPPPPPPPRRDGATPPLPPPKQGKAVTPPPPPQPRSGSSTPPVLEPEAKHGMAPPPPPPPPPRSMDDLALAIPRPPTPPLPPVMPVGPLAMVPVGYPPGIGFGPPPPPIRSAMAAPPAPPAPPTEDASSFIRRVKLVYLDRVQQEHQKQLMREQQDLFKPIPEWVFTAVLALPYLACIAWCMASFFLVLTYSLKFNADTESLWYKAVMVAMAASVFVLDVVRSLVNMIVEVRKFEIRRRNKKGDFNQRKVRPMGRDEEEHLPAFLRTKPKRSQPKTSPFPPSLDRRRPSGMRVEDGAQLPVGPLPPVIKDGTPSWGGSSPTSRASTGRGVPPLPPITTPPLSRSSSMVGSARGLPRSVSPTGSRTPPSVIGSAHGVRQGIPRGSFVAPPPLPGQPASARSSRANSPRSRPPTPPMSARSALSGSRVPTPNLSDRIRMESDRAVPPPPPLPPRSPSGSQRSRSSSSRPSPR
ncbi:hypothetical protein FOL47_007857 [Perkinsus chesapeaki]|uniref:WSC domain-containing protein n=1 Tax=Perkinsus chesapeaki TaxID=330153 RepID=A0A7J6LHL4_PERCH|nr:hypothetical protein FOL47_007857 [Perkinsus chesapeaki]